MEVEIEELDDERINRSVMVSDNDMCWDCKNQYGCPLIECLANGLVVPTDEILVLECHHFNN